MLGKIGRPVHARMLENTNTQSNWQVHDTTTARGLQRCLLNTGNALSKTNAPSNLLKNATSASKSGYALRAC